MKVVKLVVTRSKYLKVTGLVNLLCAIDKQPTSRQIYMLLINTQNWPTLLSNTQQ